MGTSQERRDPRRAAVRRTGPPPRRRRRFLTLGRAVLFGAIALLVGGVVKLLVPAMTPLLTAGLAVALGAVPLIIDLLRELPERRAKGSTLGPFAAAAFVLLVVGGGTAYALSWTIDRITSGETVRAQRLAAPVEGSVGPLQARIDKVEVTDDFTKVTFTAVNRSGLAAKVSVVDSCRLTTPQAEFRLDGLFDVLREPFFLDVPGGGTPVTRTFAFPGTPDPGRTAVTLTCGSVSWTGSDPKWSNRDFVGRPLRVADVELTPAG
ncbi:hypothetical protein [Saccharothrix variisporea]|uniref:Uncharacterized protein n=1 Tax=Saccharothrix variisporea TaxID=543527 RepID=A0A495XHX7_9PSEU|nr:hypothetical protein [Saccharothrix variisporea]RKT74091.1 hypothetical protein DFJ66_7433 [Saccharothrix variisporea]